MGGVAVDTGAGGVKAPDGGWGWAVLAGCFVITGFSYAFPKAVSVFFKELIREFGVGYSDTAWISSILLAMLYGTGRLELTFVTLCHFLLVMCPYAISVSLHYVPLVASLMSFSSCYIVFVLLHL